VKQNFQLGHEPEARRFLSMDNLVQAAVQLAEQPLQDAEEQVLLVRK
jgi:hypothetical protein